MASSTGLSANPSSSSITTATGNEVYAGVAFSDVDGDTWAQGPGYTLRGNETNNNTAERIAAEDAIISSGTTTAATWTTGTSSKWAAVMASFLPVTTASSSGTTTTTRYVSTDNLTGSNIITNASGTVVETLDYYPYGGIRIDNTSGYGGEKRKFAGHEYDSLSSLSYMDARYDDTNRGQFPYSMP